MGKCGGTLAVYKGGCAGKSQYKVEEKRGRGPRIMSDNCWSFESCSLYILCMSCVLLCGGSGCN